MNNFPFTTIIPVRITDINYGNHLSHMSTVEFFHQARALFLKEYGFDELNVENLGVILLNANYSYKKEVYFNARLEILVGIKEFSKIRFKFVYKSIDYDTKEEVSFGEEELAFYDYKNKKIEKVPRIFVEFCEKNLVS
ncbi:MAG: thioesterase family protein [Gammaproteobacteria bacterium]